MPWLSTHRNPPHQPAAPPQARSHQIFTKSLFIILKYCLQNSFTKLIVRYYASVNNYYDTHIIKIYSMFLEVYKNIYQQQTLTTNKVLFVKTKQCR
ncbi:protein of unknown function [Trichlorobacter ammonificans]|uniref:Uncharacterized protein n=1 Tax=Trichlorobacter ammonificans TaxID=2916410 RepID=A0ABN8HJ48_9BACT|nr:protein of unknown function [Trichlorobacter ammonificans]